MTYDLHLNIDSESREGHVIETIINTEHLTPEEAVLKALRSLKIESPAHEIIGALSDSESVAILDEVVEEAYRNRAAFQLRDFGL